MEEIMLPKKTEDWYSSNDLGKLLGGNINKYIDYLNKAVKMPEFKDTVKLMQSATQQALCLHKDGLIDFVQKFDIKIKDTKIFDEATKKIEQKIIEEGNINKNLNQIEENNPIIDIDWDNIIEEENITENEKELPKTLILEYKIKKLSKAVEGRINSSDKKIIKNVHNNTCMCCNVNYSGNPTMLEVHHKKQFKDLNVGEKRTLHLSDFFTLCADCHDSIHQLKDVGDEGLKQLRWRYKKNEFTEEFDEKQYNKENYILNVKQNER